MRSEPEGIGVLITADDKTLFLRPVENTAVIEALLGQAGLKAKPSPGGRLADRLLEKLDEGLQDTRRPPTRNEPYIPGRRGSRRRHERNMEWRAV